MAVAPSLADAARIAAAEGAAQGGVDLMGFWSETGFDIDAFEAAAALLAGAPMAAESGVAGL